MKSELIILDAFEALGARANQCAVYSSPKFAFCPRLPPAPVSLEVLSGTWSCAPGTLEMVFHLFSSFS